MTLVVCPEVQDPENLGSILRLAAAFQVTGVLVGKGSADPFSRRICAAFDGRGMGVPVVESREIAADLRELAGPLELELAATVLDPSAEPLASTTPAKTSGAAARKRRTRAAARVDRRVCAADHDSDAGRSRFTERRRRRGNFSLPFLRPLPPPAAPMPVPVRRGRLSRSPLNFFDRRAHFFRHRDGTLRVVVEDDNRRIAIGDDRLLRPTPQAVHHRQAVAANARDPRADLDRVRKRQLPAVIAVWITARIGPIRGLSMK